MDCLKHAISEIAQLGVGEEFLVKDLFKGYEWNRLGSGERRTLGSLFLNEVKNGQLRNQIGIVNKNSANQQLYVKL
ncbi:single-stranded DNA-binding protein [uncultured Psychrobacillus sp.]|uniref:single-stranded DNA-binding protein n=1 Tax=uncultured Psychrobacillus sp. TaxID=1551585 RepID=UPI00262C1353|nr:single-stranded DNA-binding protein [uncultured Psychrobacillus sp.]